jgi:putative nucleotidyltransferase with HDIG domain
VSDPARFLQSLAHALSTMSLYPEGHPTREAAVDTAFERLDGLSTAATPATFTLLDEEVVFGRDALRELRGWGWARRLIRVGIQRLEFDPHITRAQFDGFVHELQARLVPATADTAENRQMRDLGVRFGGVGLDGFPDPDDAEEAVHSVATLNLTLREEVETLRWLQDEVRAGAGVPLLEAEAVVHSLSVAMHSGQHVILPLLHLKEFDQYTTTHSLNVAVLAMGVAEWLGCSPGEVRAYGVAGLLHDIGKVHIPLEVLTKPGRLTEEERQVMNRHPEDGARAILRHEANLDVAAIVAYEHHIMLNGGGYPRLHYRRDCALASRLVHVCDVYDALRTRRPYRDAWSAAQAEAYLLERVGSEFDPELVRAFVTMLQQGDVQTRVLAHDAES